MRTEHSKNKLTVFALGAGLWILAAVPLFVFYGSAGSKSAFVRNTGPVFIGISVVLLILLWICSVVGWTSFPVGGGGGTQLKMIATFILAASLIGLVPVAYWSGVGLLRLLDWLRDRF